MRQFLSLSRRPGALARKTHRVSVRRDTAHGLKRAVTRTLGVMGSCAIAVASFIAPSPARADTWTLAYGIIEASEQTPAPGVDVEWSAPWYTTFDETGDYLTRKVTGLPAFDKLYVSAWWVCPDCYGPGTAEVDVLGFEWSDDDGATWHSIGWDDATERDLYSYPSGGYITPSSDAVLLRYYVDDFEAGDFASLFDITVYCVTTP